VSLLPVGGERKRIDRAILAAISDFDLDLSGIGVLTEAASGSFAVTAMAALMARAQKVVAVTRDSPFGKADEIANSMFEWAKALEVDDRLTIQIGRPEISDRSIDLVTNLGFVRPIDRRLLSQLSSDAVVALMWEPWEARSDDVDFGAARELAIPIVGTNENHAHVRTFEFLGVVAAKLLLERRFAILGSNIAIVASDPFGGPIAKTLSDLGATVQKYEPETRKLLISEWYDSLRCRPDAIVLAEHRSRDFLIGKSGIPPQRLAEDSAAIIHICGTVELEEIERCGVEIYPPQPAAAGRMTVTTGFVAASPVINLHVAGLRVGEITIRARRRGASPEVAVAAAVESGLAIAMPDAVGIDRGSSVS
jgi:hypothetical protein